MYEHYFEKDLWYTVYFWEKKCLTPFIQLYEQLHYSIPKLHKVQTLTVLCFLCIHFVHCYNHFFRFKHVFTSLTFLGVIVERKISLPYFYSKYNSFFILVNMLPLVGFFSSSKIVFDYYVSVFLFWLSFLM